MKFKIRRESEEPVYLDVQPTAEQYAKFQGSTARKVDKKYTGECCLGISQMTKSNAVPVFSNESIKDITRMRRG